MELEMEVLWGWIAGINPGLHTVPFRTFGRHEYVLNYGAHCISMYCTYVQGTLVTLSMMIFDSCNVEPVHLIAQGRPTILWPTKSAFIWRKSKRQLEIFNTALKPTQWKAHII